MVTVEMKCPVCNSTYSADTGRLKHGRQTTCNRSCSYKLRADGLNKQVALQCAVCSKDVQRCPSHIKARGGLVYCSRDCKHRATRDGIIQRVVTKPYVYTPEGKAAIVASSSTPKGKRSWHWITCINCGVLFDDPSDGRKRKSGLAFCSLDCCNIYRRGEHNPAWRGGHPKYYGPDWRPIRRAARLRDDYSCRRCGKKTKRPPDVHHIQPVGSFDNPNDAHTMDNVVCLCHACHMYAEWRGIDFPIDFLRGGLQLILTLR